MGVSRLLVRSVRFLVRSVLFPALALLLVLGMMSGGSGPPRLKPAPGRIVSELQLHKRLPAGTTLSMGKKTDPLAIRIDAEGRLAITTPRTANFGGLVSTGVDEATRLVSSGQYGIPTGLVAPAKP